MNRPFAKRFNAPRLSPAEAERQGRVTRFVLDALGDPAAAVMFMNSHHSALGGRPLDLAIADEKGLRAVEAAVREILAGHAPGQGKGLFPDIDLEQ